MAGNESIWDRFEAMLHVHAPALLRALHPPATEAEIRGAESAVGVRFPDEIRQAYLRHNGSIRNQNSACGSGLLFFPFNWWASLEELVDEWRGKVRVSASLRDGDPDGLFATYKPWWDDLKVRPVWWNERWIPIGLSGTPTNVYIDLDPAPQGVAGQLVVDHGMQDPEWIASDMNHYLEMLIDRVERKVIVFREGWVLADPDQSVFGEGVYDWNAIG